MTYQREPDAILGAWLDENAVPLPSETRHAIDVGIRSIPQRRQPSWLPRRLLPMPYPLRLAAMAIVVIAVASGAFLLLRPGADLGVGGPGDASPTPSASGSDAPWTSYTSPDLGFTLSHPPDWSPFPEGDRVFFSGAADWGTGISVGRYDGGLEPDAWLAANCGRTNAFTANRPDESEGLVPCNVPIAEWTTTTVDGFDGFEGESPDGCCRDLVVFTEDAVYVITGWHNAAYDMALFDAFVATIDIHP
jgi:hypothetical protein